MEHVNEFDRKMQTIKDLEELKRYRAIGTLEKVKKMKKEEDILKFYYCESEDDYLIGIRVDTMYYARWSGGSFTFSMSRYLPWGKGAYPSEPKEISFSDWLNGFIRVHIN